MTKRIVSRSGLMLMALLLPSAVSAQRSRPEPTVDIAKAEALETEARGFTQDLRDLGKAAKLLREAADYRPPEDPIAVSDLATSARLSFYRQDFDDARRTMVGAAERALGIGDVDRAANLFLDAAHLSVELNDGAAARAHMERARLLSHSPHLTATQHARLASRLGPAPAIVADNRETGR